ncbi:hypothetical protein BH10ACI1_BH10ACI1_32700 [soil metagenome]
MEYTIKKNKNKILALNAFCWFITVLLILFSVRFTDASLSAIRTSEIGQIKNIKAMSQTRKEVAPGDWGGTGINLSVKKGGANFEFDCAEAELSEKLMIDKKGNFSVEGKYLRRSPGPIRIGFQPKPQPANFVGKITGKNMMLKIILKENNEEIGIFQLERGKTARIHRCY